MGLAVALVCLVCVSTELPWDLDGVTAPLKRQYCQSALCSKSDRAAGPLCEDFLAPVLGGVEYGGVLGAELAGDTTVELAIDKAGHAPRVAF